MPVRVQVPSLDIDLAVVSSQVTLPGNQRGYPLCDVAHYWTRFDLPGTPGTSWVFAHAQEGMFLPLLEEAIATNGRGLFGREILLQLQDGRLLTYEVTVVRQHATDTSIAKRRNPDSHRLVLQTSEGVGDEPKLMVAAKLTWARFTRLPAPKPRPRLCSAPQQKPTPKPTVRPTRKPGPSPETSPEPSPELSPDASPEATPGASPSLSPGPSAAPSSGPSPLGPTVDEPRLWPPNRTLLAVMGVGATFLASSLMLAVWLRRRPVT